MPEIPEAIAELARAQHRQLLTLDRRTKAAVERRFAAAAERVRERISKLDPDSFGAQQSRVVLLLEKLVGAETSEELERLLVAAVESGNELAPGHAGSEIGAWVGHYGYEARPINLGAVAELDREILIERIPRSLEIWGSDIARGVRDELAIATTAREPREAIVDSVAGIIKAERWKADRIVRTELMSAYNKAHRETLDSVAGVVGDDLAKSAIATFDVRTDDDSLPVHGQVVELDGNFIDGEGREYPEPPGRPNDREKLIPWLRESGAEILSTEEGVARVEAARGAQRERQQERRAAAARGKTYEERRTDMIRSWTNSAHSRRSTEIKTAAHDVFDLPGVVWSRRDYEFGDGELDQTGRDLRRLYDETQSNFAESGTDTVTLYRGIKGPVDLEGSFESWTSDLATAQKFGTYDVIEREIDVRKILAYHEGPGWQNGRYGEQFEYVVLSDVPALEWKEEPFRVGLYDSEFYDKTAERAGPWGIVGGDLRDHLIHIPSGRALTTDVYSRDTLREIAKRIDRGGYVDVGGELLFDPASARSQIAELADNVIEERLEERIRDRGELDFTPKNFEVGFFDAREIDPEAETAGPWGIMAAEGRGDTPPEVSLYHLPSGREILTRQDMTRDDLRRVASDLDKFVDESGALPSERDELEDRFWRELESSSNYYSRNRVDGFSDYTGVSEFLDMGGVEFPVLNPDVDIGPLTTWSRNRTINVLQDVGDGQFRTIEATGYTKRNFFIYKTDSSWENPNGYGVEDWHIVHTKTGIELHQGVSMPLEGFGPRGSDIGGWRKMRFEDVADELETMLDRNGAVIPERAEVFNRRIFDLQFESTPGGDLRVDVGLTEEEVEDYNQNPLSRRTRPEYIAEDFEESARLWANLIDDNNDLPLFDDLEDSVDTYSVEEQFEKAPTEPFDDDDLPF